MKLHSIFFLLLVLTFSCSENKGKETDPIEQAAVNTKKQTLEQMLNKHIESQLSITDKEKYSFKIYKEHLDGDDKMDAVITVNRLEYALNKAIEKGNTAKQAEIGFTGPFNYIFYYDGEKNQLSPPITISSSPHASLKIHFSNILSEGYKDIEVDYTIRNSAFRDIFTIVNHSPIQVFQWKLYDRLGEGNPEAYYIEYGKGTVSLSKDILIYNGTLENGSNVKDIYNFDPKISKKGEMVHRFFYLEEQGKFFTNK